MRLPALPPIARSLTILAAVVSLALALVACNPAPAVTGPAAVVQEALVKTAAKDLDGLRGLACAGQEDIVRTQLGLPAGMDLEQLLPGLDMQAVLDAVRIDVGDVKLGEAVIDGDVAEVPVGGTVKVTFDKAAMRPILRQVLATQGTSMTDEQLDALLKTLEAYGQDLPLDQTIRLVRENGAWKICQESIGAPAGS